MRGTQHSMGGHSICKGGVVIDLKHFSNVVVSEDRESVTCGPGAVWMDLIRVLNPFGKSPVTMQSYCSFSVGGTLSVNGHGITTDESVAESVLEMDIVLPDGSLKTCKRDCPESGELFSLVLGGYGMFGIIVSVTMQVADNYALSAETIPVNSHDFPFVYKGVLQESGGDAGSIAVKLARLDITSPDSINLYLFRKRPFSPTHGVEGPPCGVVGDLETKDEGMGTIKRLLYKWLAPPMQEIRYQLETQYGGALDWEEAFDKNSLMYQTARPLAQLSEPFFLADDTFILQEYFIPQERFNSFLSQIKPIYKDIVAAGSAATRRPSSSSAPPSHVHLLNTTIRYVHKDTVTFLPYSQDEGGSFAFVLYFRLARNSCSLAALEGYHRRLTEVALSLGGTFFLPYQHHYTDEQLLRAYPMFDRFIQKKVEMDPEGLFDSCWFRRYGLPRAPPEYQQMFASRDARNIERDQGPSPNYHNGTTAPATPAYSATLAALPPSRAPMDAPPIVSERRSDSFSRLMRSSSMRCAFRDKFLKHVFDVAQSSHLFAVMSRLKYDIRCSTDSQVYAALGKALEDETTKAGLMMRELRKLLQASRQKAQLAAETHRLLSRLGLVGCLEGYASIGDYGRMVLPFHEVLHLRPGGAVYVVHDDPGDPYSMAAAVERGCVDVIGKFAAIDYTQCTFPAVPTGSVDLVTMNQGLHHLPQDRLATFLSEVVRVLRPGGVFITREHDANPELIPMLDMAHFIFNAVMGVPQEDEEREVRAFRPIAQWREIVVGLCKGELIDTQQYEFQESDPTMDIMLAFRKVGTLATAATATDGAVVSAPLGSLEKELLKAHPFYKTFMELPHQFQEFAVSGLEGVSGMVDGLSEVLAGAIAPEGFEGTLVSLIAGVLQPWQSVLDKLRVMLANATPRSLHLYDTIPIELFVVFRLLERRVKDKKASAVEALAVAFVQQVVRNMLLPTPIGVDSDVPPADCDDGTSATPRGPTSKRELAKSVASAACRLAEAMPSLMDRAYLLEEARVPSPLVDAMHGLLPGGLAVPTSSERDKLATALGRRLTTNSLVDLHRILEAIVETKPALDFDTLMCRGGDLDSYLASLVPLEGDLPGVPPMLPLADGLSLWSLLALASLGDPNVTLTRTVSIAAGFYGFSDIVDVHRAAQAIYLRRWGASSATDVPLATSAALWASPGDLTSVQKALQQLQGCVVCTEMSGESIANVTGVAAVLCATYQGKDVTTIVRSQLFDEATETTLFENVDLDHTFNFGITPLSKYFYGKRKVVITYRSSEVTANSFVTVSATQAVIGHMPRSALLAQSNTAARTLGPQNEKSEATLFKFAEWMQVHMLHEFAESLHHTPWYRYPFTAAVQKYVSVVSQLTKRVRAEKGASIAFASKSSLAISIPAVVMGALYGQLQLLALPLRAIAGDSYDAHKLLQRVVIYVPEDALVVHDTAVDSSSSTSSSSSDAVPKAMGDPCETAFPMEAIRRHNATLEALSDSSPYLFSVTVPPFAALTQTLIEVLQYNNHAIPLSIQGHTRVNVHLRANACEEDTPQKEDDGGRSPSDLLPMSAAFECMADAVGGELVVEPFTLGTTVNSSLLIPVANLGRLVRLCSGTGCPIRIVAIYDFY